MAKLFLIIICVCTACVHLAWSQMARKDVGNKIDYEFSKVHRMKRHTGHSSSNTITENLIAMNPNTDAFIEKLFKEFTNGNRETMNLIQFENMMKTLKLDRFIEDNQLQRQSQQHSAEKNINENHHGHSNETVS